MIAPLPTLLAVAALSVTVTVGTPAPSFSRPATDGHAISLAQFKGKKTVVLAFFPQAFTSGCTREMSSFRDFAGKFAAGPNQVLGISTDTLDQQKKFASSLKLPFPLLADTDGSVAKAYGVLSPSGRAERTTFIIGTNGKITKVLHGQEALDPAPALAACPLHRADSF